MRVPLSNIPRGFVAIGLAALLIAAVAVLGLPAGAARGDSESNTLVLAGCGSNAPILRVLTEAFRERHPDVSVDVWAIGSTNGIWMVAAGAFPVGLVSRPLTESELGLGLTVVPYARTPLVFAAHPTVSDDDLSVRELLAIQRGSQRRWRSGHEVVLVTREEGDGSIQLLRSTVPGFDRAYSEGRLTAGWMVAYSEQQMHRTLVGVPYALGLSDLGTLKIERLPLKALAVNGVPPTLENLASGKYPFVKTLAFVFRPDRLPIWGARFLEFVESRDRQRILALNGYLPAESAARASKP
jgi:phosphate transport system substrate-binding protein